MQTVRRGHILRSVLAGSVGLALLSAGLSTGLGAQAAVLGEWRTLSYLMPINPVHLALLNTGEVLVVAGSGNLATETLFQAAVWNPQANTIVTQPVGWDMFCNAMVALSDGRIFINGGNLAYNPFLGSANNAVFDPATHTFTDKEPMAHGRWYPTATVIGDGRVLTFSGLTEFGTTSGTAEIYTANTGWSQEYLAGWVPPLYPRMHLLNDGRVFYAGSGTGSRFFDALTATWSGVIATTNYSVARTYGTSVLLPLTPANGYAARVMIFGGGNPATETTEIIDLSQPTPVWQYGPAMSQPRIEMNATILPSGKVLAVGGSKNDEDASTASLNADLYDPTTNTFSPAGANAYPRLYHSGSLLLPDATVMLVGGNPGQGSYEKHIEIYSPAYLFKADGTPASRPTITGITSNPIGFGNSFEVQTPDAANIASVVLVRPGAQTHAFDMDQRLIRLPHTAGSGVLNVTAPPNGNIAPPGYYMLFVLDSAGVPSLATFVQLAMVTDFGVSVTPGSRTVPRAGSTTYAATVAPLNGFTGTVNFSVGGLPPGATASFSPSSVNTSGSTTLSVTTGDPTPPPSGLTITGPISVTVGQTAQYRAYLDGQPLTSGIWFYTYESTATIDHATGILTAVAPGPARVFFDYIQPDAITASIPYPISVVAVGGPPPSYPLTIRGTSGAVTHTVDVTLVIGTNQTPSATIASPSSNVTVNPGGAVSYTGSGTDPDGNITAYAWSFPGGVPDSSSVAAPGNVVYSTPGTFVASLTVTDNAGAVVTAATRTVTVSDFGVSTTPGSRTVVPGGSTTYAATVAPLDGFTGTVNFSVGGLPPGATASFSPSSVNTSGSTTLSVTAGDPTPPPSGLTITGPISVTVGQTAQYRAYLDGQPLTSGVWFYTYESTATIDHATGILTAVAPGPARVFFDYIQPDAITASIPYPISVVAVGGPPPSYPLMIRGTSGPVTHTVDVTLVIGTNQPPVASIMSPSSNLTVNPGGAVSYAGSGNDPDGSISTYAWSFPGGVPASSSAATPGNVVYSTPGTFVASLTVTDDDGAPSTAATRTVTVSDFGVSATPGSRTVLPGGSTTYAATVAPLNGFTGTVGFTVTGLPSGATASFSPSSVNTSGSTTLSVATDSTTPPGSYPLTLRGTSGAVTHTANVTLVIGTNQPPSATITSPLSNVTVNPGGAVSYAGSGTDPDGSITTYAWSFPGGVPASSSVAVPGNVVYSTPGTFVASLTVTDNTGAPSTAATRTVTVSDFGVSTTPGSRSLLPGGSTTYTATVAPLNGFTGTVAFTVTGLPSGTTASFSPSSVNTSGSTTLSVATNSTTPPGSYPLTLRGTSGPATHTANVMLIIVADFTITVTPTSRTVAPDGSTTYIVTVVGGPSFSGAANLSVTNLPKFVSAQFTPSSVTSGQPSTLSINTKKNVARGTYTLSVTGTANGLVRSTDVTLIVQ